MSVDIRLKHSSQAGKVPDAGSLKSGEVAINTADVKAYIKNSDGQVVQIAGGDNPTNDGRYLRIDSGANAQTVASTDTTTFSGQVNLPGGGGDTQALQKQEVEELIADPNGPADGNYLKLGSGTFEQTVASTGKTNFNGPVQNYSTENQARWAFVSSTSDNETDNSSGIFYTDTNFYTLDLRDAAGNVTSLTSRGNLVLNSDEENQIQFIDFRKKNTAASNIAYSPVRGTKGSLLINTVSQADVVIGGGGGSVGIGESPGTVRFFIGGSDTYDADSVNFVDSVNVKPTVSGSTASGYTGIVVQPDITGLTTPVARGIVIQPQNVPETVDKYVGMRVIQGLAGANEVTDINGIDSAITASDDAARFNLVASGSAPNFFRGHTYVGGTMSRNTLELWQSTLTEEQLEQLEAGTLAAPANVSSPGDGSFARQWWYNQQSAEDQALIDSGELEYPPHFQAANFVDTFNIDETTNLQLRSAGEIRTGNWNRGAQNVEGISINQYGRISCQKKADGVVFEGYLNENETFKVGSRGNAFFADKVGIGTDSPGPTLEVNGSFQSNGIKTSGEGISFSRSDEAEFAVRIIADAAPGFAFRADDYTIWSKDQSNKYLTLSAEGRVGVMKDNPEEALDVNGRVKANNVVFRIAPEDPSNYITTTEEVENTTQEVKTYVGPELNVKDTLLALLERIEELESGGGGSSDFESRIAALEVDMARFKAI